VMIKTLPLGFLAFGIIFNICVICPINQAHVRLGLSTSQRL
jgi:hypothetical protein